MTLSSPNHMIWEYFASLKRQSGRAAKSSGRFESQETSLAIFLAVTIVEIFFNLYFRVVVSEPAFQSHEEKLVMDLRKRISLERKLREWPKRILGEDLDAESTAMKAFYDLKELRNKLVHFASTHSSIELPGYITIRGLADTSVYSSLNSEVANRCPDIVRGVVYELFRLRGVDALDRDQLFHFWFGELSANKANVSQI